MSSLRRPDRSVQGDDGQDDVNKYAESLLSCPVCMERFDDDAVVNGRRAKSLPECRHTFCLPCLRRCCESASGRGVDDFVAAADRRRDFAGRSFPCPTCRRMCRVPDIAGGLDALPNDFRISQVRELLDRMKKATSGVMAARTTTSDTVRRTRLTADEPVCSVCQSVDDTDSDGDRLAEVKCLTCERDFCRRCADRHAGNAVFRNHVTSPIERPVKVSEQNDDDDYDDDRRWRCLEHNEPLGYYCAKCARPVCTVCVIDVAGGHDQHPVTTRGESAPPLRAALAARLPGLNQRIGAVELARRSIADLKSRREAMYREAREDVQRAAVDARRLVDSIETELTTEAQRRHDEDERLIDAADEKLADVERKLLEMNDAVRQAVERLSALTSRGDSDATGGDAAAATGGDVGGLRKNGLPGFRKFSELVSSSESLTEDDFGLKGRNVPTVPDNLIRGIVAVSDVFVRIGSIERQKIDLQVAAAAETGGGSLGDQRLNGGKTTTPPVEIDRSQENTVNVGIPAGGARRLEAVTGVVGTAPYSEVTTVARVNVSSSKDERVSLSNKLSSQPDHRDDVPERETMKSFASVQLNAGQTMMSATTRANDDGDTKDGIVDGRQGAMIWESDTVEAGRGICFLDRGELVVANCPSDVDRDSPWRRTTTATAGKRSGDERLKVFDCTGAVVRQMTGSMVSEPWSVAYDPYGGGGASVVVTERGSTAIKILKTSLSFRDVALWRPASVIKPNAVAVMTVRSSSSSLYVLTDAARYSPSRISLHSPVAGRVLRVRTFAVEADDTSSGCGLNFVIVDRHNRILVSDSESGYVSAYDIEGRRLMTFSHVNGEGNAASAAAGSSDGGCGRRRMLPQGLAIDAADNILVADQSDCCNDGGQQREADAEAMGRVLKFSPDGQFIELVQSWKASDYGRPWGLAYDDDGRMLAVSTDAGVRVYRL